MKILCETTGDFMLVDLTTGQEVSSTRPAVISMTNFFSQRSMIGQLRKLGDLTDEATDAEFAKYVTDSDGDIDLAVDAFLSSFGVEAPSEKAPAKRRKAKKEVQPEPVEPVAE